MYKKLLMIFIANSIAFASLNSMSEEKERLLHKENAPVVVEGKIKDHSLNFNNESDYDWRFCIRKSVCGLSLPGYVNAQKRDQSTYDLNHPSIGKMAYFEIYRENEREEEIQYFFVKIEELLINKVCVIVLTNNKGNPIEFIFQDGLTNGSFPEVTTHKPTKKTTDTRLSLDY